MTVNSTKARTKAASVRMRAALLESQRRVLERIASGAPLSEILDTLIRLIEDQAMGMRCAVLLVDSLGQRLTFAAAPSIPEDFKARIEPLLRIAPDAGTCGAAAFLRKPVYTKDAETDPRWKGWHEILGRNGFRAIWSTPILSDDNVVLGTFAMYYGEARLPSPEHIQLIDMAIQMARVAIQYKRDEERLRASEEKFRLIAENARDLIVIVDTSGRWLYNNPSYQRLLGDPDALTGTNIFDSVYPEDRARVREEFEEMVRTGVGHCFEFRIVSKNGEIRYFQSEGSPIGDASGKVTAVVGVSRDITERKRNENELRISTAQLQALSRRLVELQESERRQLSRELHDRIGQSLTALNINLDVLKKTLASYSNNEVDLRLEDSVGLLESTMEAVENVMSELRPPMLDDHGLGAALDWHARNFSRRTGIAVAVRASGPAVRPAPQIEIALFRIAQEGLNNVAKHASARRVEIALSHTNEECVMSVRDDGIGFDDVADISDKPKPGLGMVTMRERAQAVDGRFEVQALAGRGTQLTVRIPC
jgi:PAS domain S-box-containing protein